MKGPESVGGDDDISEAIFFSIKRRLGFGLIKCSQLVMVWSSFGSNDVMKVLNTLRIHHLYRLVSLCAFGSRLCHPLVNVISQVARSQIDIDLVLCKSLSVIDFKRHPCEFGTESNDKTFYRRCDFYGDVVRHMMWICICSLE